MAHGHIPGEIQWGAPLMDQVLASVIIPTRNRPHAVVHCLDALAAQSQPPGTFEVIVVDDGSEPALALDPARWASSFALTLIHQQNTGPAGARNRGVADARGAFLAFTDDDCRPRPTWLETLIAALRAHPDALIGGSTFNGLAHDLFAHTSQVIVDLVYGHFNRDPAQAAFFASNNIAVRRDRFLAAGGFDAAFDAPAAEDRELCDRWRAQQRPLVWIPTARMEHRHGQRLGDFLRLHWRYGQGAFVFQRTRRRRASGTLAEDFRFHIGLPKAVWRRLADHAPARGLRVLATLLLWQLANAMGFMWAAARQRFSRK